MKIKPVLATLALFSLSQAPSTYPVVGVIDFYGLRTVSETQVRQVLGVHEGDSVDVSHLYKWEKAETQKIRTIPGVQSASLTLVCCTDDHKSMLYVGIEEPSSPCLTFRPAPISNIRLTDDTLRASKKVEEAVQNQVLAGDASEDDSQGRALFGDAQARTLELALIPLAEVHLQNLKDVLHNSSDEEHRATAAEVLGYVKNKQSVVLDLVAAMQDSSSLVRNNAMRALMVFTKYAPKPPALKVQVPYRPFVALLNSCNWTDRNKSSAAIAQLTDSRNPALLRELADNALPSLLEMARWKDLGHAYDSLTILGRIAGLSDEQISSYLAASNRGAILAAAQKGAATKH